MNIIYIGYTFIKRVSRYRITLYSFFTVIRDYLFYTTVYDHNLCNTYLSIFIYNVFNGLTEQRTKHDSINKPP